jgi:hypothetical protein
MDLPAGRIVGGRDRLADREFSIGEGRVVEPGKEFAE